MRKAAITYLVCIISVIVTLAGCGTKSDEFDYDETHLYGGTWICSGGESGKYPDGYTFIFNSNHTGESYLEGFDPIQFDWRLDNDMLRIDHHGESSAAVFSQRLIITELSINTMNCYDMIDPDEKLKFRRQ